MKTISAKCEKGQEPRRRLIDDVRLAGYIVLSVIDYFVTGRRVRREWLTRQEAGEKYFLDQE